jgi:hypothetical protein
MGRNSTISVILKQVRAKSSNETNADTVTKSKVTSSRSETMHSSTDVEPVLEQS